MNEFILSLAPGWALTHASVLLVALPLIAGAIAAALPWGRAAWGVVVAVMAASLFFSAILTAQVLTGGAFSYTLGGWAPPVGIEYRIDGLNVGMLLLVSAIGFLVSLYAPEAVEDEIDKSKHPLFYAAFLICFAGLLGVAITGDAFNLFVFLEISSISTYALVAMGAGRDRRALTAAYNYLILGTIGATFFVIGVGFLYMATGTLNMADIARIVVDMPGDRVIEVAFAFILVGIGLKAALFPLHLWLPNAYAFAPNFVTVFLATTATKVAFYVIIRFLFDVFYPGSAFVEMSLLWVVTPLAILGMILASAQAIFQVDARRLLAYSSVAQVGYMMLGLGIGTALGVSAGVLHLLNHALMKGALFIALGAFAYSYGVRRIADFKGLGQAMPGVAAAFTIGALSLVGVPFTVGFISKFYLIQAALASGWWWAVAAIVVSSVLAVFYVYRILVVMWVQPAPAGRERIRAVPLMILVPLWILVFANIYFGIDASFMVDLSSAAAEAAINGSATVAEAAPGGEAGR